ncbi:unnamed protein product, partial [Cyprideis torosa]
FSDASSPSITLSSSTFEVKVSSSKTVALKVKVTARESPELEETIFSLRLNRNGHIWGSRESRGGEAAQPVNEQEARFEAFFKKTKQVLAFGGGILKITCKECGHQETSVPPLRQHIREKHFDPDEDDFEELEGKLLEGDTNGEFACSSCSKKFSLLSTATYHTMFHGPVFECDCCGERTNELGSTRRHRW